MSNAVEGAGLLLHPDLHQVRGGHQAGGERARRQPGNDLLPERGVASARADQVFDGLVEAKAQGGVGELAHHRRRVATVERPDPLLTRDLPGHAQEVARLARLRELLPHHRRLGPVDGCLGAGARETGGPELQMKLLRLRHLGSKANGGGRVWERGGTKPARPLCTNRREGFCGQLWARASCVEAC